MRRSGYPPRPSPRSIPWQRRQLRDELFSLATDSASLSTSTSTVLRPSRRSNSRTRCTNSRTLLAATTSSSVLTAARPPRDKSCLHSNNRLGETPCRRAMGYTVMPDWIVSSIRDSSCSALQRRRRSRPVMISIRVVYSDRGVCLGVSLGPQRCAKCPVEVRGAPIGDVGMWEFLPRCRPSQSVLDRYNTKKQQKCPATGHIRSSG